MALDVGSLTGSISIDDQLSSVLTSLASKIESFGKTFASSTDQVKTSSTDMGDHVQGVFGSLAEIVKDPIQGIKDLSASLSEDLLSSLSAIGPEAAVAAGAIGGLAAVSAAVAGAVFGLADHAANAGEQVKAFSIMSGMAVENVGPLEFAVKAAGGSLDDLSSIIKKMDVKAATDSTGKFADALKQIGINATQFKQMDAQQQILALGEGFRNAGDNVNIMSVATNIAGKGMAANIPLIEKMSQDLIDQGKVMGVAWTEQSIKDSETFKVALNSVEESIGNIGTKIGVALLPALSGMMDRLAKSPAFMNGVTTAVTVLANGLGVLVEWNGKLVQGTLDLMAPLVAVGTFVGTVLVDVWKQVINWITQFVGTASKFEPIKIAVATVGAVFTAMKDTAVQAITFMLAELEKIPGIGPIIKDAVDKSAASFTAMTAAAATVGAATDKVGSALLGVGHAYEFVGPLQEKGNKAALAGTEVLDKNAKAVQAQEDALLGVSKSYEVLSTAIDNIIAKGNLDIATKENIATAIEKLIKGHHDLTAAQMDFVESNAEMFDGTTKKMQAYTDQFATTFTELNAAIKRGMSMEDLVKNFGAGLETMRAAGIKLGVDLVSQDDNMHKVLEQKWFDSFNKIVDNSKTFYTKVGVQSTAWLKQAQNDVLALQKTYNDMLVANAALTQTYYAAQIYAAQRVGDSQATILQLQVAQSNAAYAEQIRQIQEKGDKDKAALDKEDTNYQTTFASITNTVNTNMTAAAIAHGVAVQKMVDAVPTLAQAWENTIQGIVSQASGFAQQLGGISPAMSKLFTSAIPDMQGFASALTGMGNAAEHYDAQGQLVATDTKAMVQEFAAGASILYQVGNQLWDIYNSMKRDAEVTGILTTSAKDLGTQLSINTVNAIMTTNDSLTTLYTGADRTNKAFNDLLASMGGKVTQSFIMTVGEALNLSAVIKDMGGITEATLPKIEQLAGVLAQLSKSGGDVGRQAVSELSTVVGQLATYLASAASGTGAWDAATVSLLNTLVTVPGGIDVIDKNWAALVKSGTDGVGLWSDGIQGLIDKMRAAGQSGANIQAALDAQMASASKGIGAGLAVPAAAVAARATTQTKLDTAVAALKPGVPVSSADAANIAALNKELLTQQQIIDATSIHSQDAANAIASSVVGGVAAEIAAGKTFVQAIKDQTPAIQALDQQLQQTGFTGGAMFDGLKRSAALVGDAVAGPALTSIEGYTAGIVGLANAGQLSGSTFKGLADQIGGTEKALEAQGKARADVLPAMQNDLQVIWEEQQKNHVALDDYTQGLVNEAVQQGLVGESHKSVANQMLDLTKRMTDAVEGLAKVFGVVLTPAIDGVGTSATDAAGVATGPDGLDAIAQKAKDLQTQVAAQEAWDKMSSNAKTAAGDVTSYINGIPTKHDVTVNYTATGSINPPQGSNRPDVQDAWGRSPGDPRYGLDPNPGDNPKGQAAGGDYYVTKPTWFLAGEAGPEAASFSGANNSRGWGAAPLPPSSSSSGKQISIVVSPTIVAWDGQSVDNWLTNGGDVKLTQAIVKVANDFKLSNPL